MKETSKEAGNKAIAELLKARYKVINDYPNNQFEVGSVITTDSELWVNKDDIHLSYDNLDEYPHLFKKLEWWEERKIEEMPLYLKEKNYVVKVTMYKEYKLSGLVFISDDGIEEFIHSFLPATEQEYNNQNQQP